MAIRPITSKTGKLLLCSTVLRQHGRTVRSTGHTETAIWLPTGSGSTASTGTSGSTGTAVLVVLVPVAVLVVTHHVHVNRVEPAPSSLDLPHLPSVLTDISSCTNADHTVGQPSWSRHVRWRNTDTQRHCGCSKCLVRHCTWSLCRVHVNTSGVCGGASCRWVCSQ